MLLYIAPFAIMLLFVLVYYFAFEYSRYKTAKMMAEGLGGRAVFRIGKSYMRRRQDGVEERAWIMPDDKMAWGSILTAVLPPAGMLFVQRRADLGFRFHIEPKTGMLFRTVSLGSLKDAAFNVPQLDQSLRLRTTCHTEAATCFAATEEHQALVALFRAGFTELKGEHGTVVATMKGVSAESLNLASIDRYFGHLRAFRGLGDRGRVLSID